IISDQMGQVFMSAFLPGHSTSLEESHPISEEVYRLAGSLYDHSSGWSHPGDYSYRQPHLFHGPLASIDGTMSIVRSSGPITTRHRSPGSYWSGLSTASLVATYRPPSLANLGGGQ